MPDYSQSDRPFRVDTPLGKDVLLLEGFTGKETVSRPFGYTLQLFSTQEDLDPLKLLREKVRVTVELPDGSERTIHGKVSRFIQKRRAGDLTEYEAEVVPWLWFLSLSRDCRIFQNRTVLEIIEEVFQAYPDATYEIRCLDSYASREYCVQYRETDLNFVSRLLEGEGIYYFFQHSPSEHTLVLGDSPDTIPDAPQGTASVESDPHSTAGPDVITEFQREHTVHSTAVTLTDYDYLQPSLDLQSTASAESFEEIYDFPGKYTRVPDGEFYADLYLKERSSRQEVVRGAGTCRGFVSGHQFELTDYYRRDANQPYLLTFVSHRARGGGYLTQDPDPEYQNRFECIPMRVPFRPAMSSRPPRVQGSQTALVVGPSGEEIYTDEHGRVKVQFPWDRQGRKDENSSCWIRVSQPWAGKAWGAMAIPRIGQEVVVDFLEGDPDRPIITGRVYNAEQIPPYSLPGDKTQTGIKSRSSKGGDTSTFNEIRMEDKKGNELLYIHAEKDQDIVVETDRTDNVGHDETISVGNDQTISVGNDRKEEVASDHTESIGSDMKLSVGADRTVSVGKKLSESIGADRTESVSDDRSSNVGGDDTLDVGGDESVAVGGKRSVNVGGDSAHKAKKILIQGDDQVTIKSGSASIVLKKSGDVTIKGKKITIKGSGDVIVKGSKIAQN